MRIFRTALAVGLVAVLAAGCGGGGTSDRAAEAEPDTTDTKASITAQGVGKATGVPDVITVEFSLHTEQDNAQNTLAENNLLTQAVFDSLKGQGVEDKDVQTTNVSVGPRFDDRIPPRIVGYYADNIFSAKLRDLTKAGAQIDAMVGVGGDALHILGIGYSINDPTALLAQARTDAVKRASDQAKQMADGAGIVLGKVRTITEVQPQPVYPYNDLRLSNGVAAAGDAASTVPLAAGSQEVTVTVTIVYDLA
jgi:uncharacterized protein YggE